jgi:hypothetical protein
MFLFVDLVRFFVCAASATTINSTQQQQQKLQQINNQIQQFTTNATNTTAHTTIKRFGRFFCWCWFALVCFCRHIWMVWLPESGLQSTRQATLEQHAN